jgi:hypothetical protein
VVDAEGVEAAVGDPLEDPRVRLGEDARVLHAERDELVDVEEAPVVDLARGATPAGERVVLGVEEGAERTGRD